jgi:hypothetical protein
MVLYPEGFCSSSLPTVRQYKPVEEEEEEEERIRGNC